MQHGFAWQIPWALLGGFTTGLIVLYGVKFLRKELHLDKLLFLLGVYIFVLFEPLHAALNNAVFPYVYDYIHLDSRIIHKTGLLITLYIYTFYVGRRVFLFFIRFKKVRRKKNRHPKSSLLFAYVILSVLPFFIYGKSNILDNFIQNVAIRSTGYVTFASGGLGSQNPIISLLIHIIPATIFLLWWKTRSQLRKITQAVYFLFMLIILLLYVSMGGRSGVVLVFVVIFIHWYLNKRKSSIPIVRIAITGVLLLSLLYIQLSVRENNQSSTEKVLISQGMKGYQLNKELAYISNVYGEQKKFIVSNKPIEQLVFPLLETTALFIANPIPRILWNSKPIDPSFGVYNKERTGFTGFEGTSNITPTIPGRYYMKYGLIGLIEIGILIGILFALGNKLVLVYSKQKESGLSLITAITFLVILFTATRDFAPGKFYPLLFLVLFEYLNKVKKVC
jgi:oligosaccharide repeat unit polymerase